MKSLSVGGWGRGLGKSPGVSRQGWKIEIPLSPVGSPSCQLPWLLSWLPASPSPLHPSIPPSLLLLLLFLFLLYFPPSTSPRFTLKTGSGFSLDTNSLHPPFQHLNIFVFRHMWLSGVWNKAGEANQNNTHTHTHTHKKKPINHICLVQRLTFQAAIMCNKSITWWGLLILFFLNG